MVDVLVVALILAVLTLRIAPSTEVTTDAHAGIGMYYFAAYCVLSLATGQLLGSKWLRLGAGSGRDGPQAEAHAPTHLGHPARTAIASLLCGYLVAVHSHTRHHLTRTFVIPSGQMRACTLFSDSNAGHLSGAWTANGEGHGGHDNTIVHAWLVDPSGNRVESWDHEVTGSVSEAITLRGPYSIVFDNSGVVRSTARTITFDLIIESN